jgi:hypothetical protein
MKKKAITLTLLTIVGMIVFYFSRPSASHVEKPKVSYSEGSESPSAENTEEAKFSPQITKPIAAPLNDQMPAEYGDTKNSNNNDQNNRAQFFEQISPILQERLLGEGFTQHEADQTSKELAVEFGKGEEVIRYSEAAYRAAKILNLSEEKKDQLNIAVLKSIAAVVDIPFDRWNQCMNYRTKSMSPCVQDIAQELSRSVAAAISGQSLLGEERGIVAELSKKAINDAINRCKIPVEDANRALRIVLSDCPK